MGSGFFLSMSAMLTRDIRWATLPCGGVSQGEFGRYVLSRRHLNNLRPKCMESSETLD